MNPLTSRRFRVQFPILQGYAYFLILQKKLPPSRGRTGLVVNPVTLQVLELRPYDTLGSSCWTSFHISGSHGISFHIN